MADFDKKKGKPMNFKLDDDIEIHGCVYGPPPWLEKQKNEARDEKEEDVSTKLCNLVTKKKPKD